MALFFSFSPFQRLQKSNFSFFVAGHLHWTRFSSHWRKKKKNMEGQYLPESTRCHSLSKKSKKIQISLVVFHSLWKKKMAVLRDFVQVQLCRVTNHRITEYLFLGGGGNFEFVMNNLPSTLSKGKLKSGDTPRKAGGVLSNCHSSKFPRQGIMH